MHLKEEKTSECHIVDGEFFSPMELFLPGIVPKESQKAHFQLVLPLKWKNENCKPICVHFAGTGDHVWFLVLQLIFSMKTIYFLFFSYLVLLETKTFHGKTITS